MNGDDLKPVDEEDDEASSSEEEEEAEEDMEEKDDVTMSEAGGTEDYDTKHVNFRWDFHQRWIVTGKALILES